MIGKAGKISIKDHNLTKINDNIPMNSLYNSVSHSLFLITVLMIYIKSIRV